MSVQDSRELGQFIPLHYHFQMLSNTERMSSFKAAIAVVVSPGASVLDLGSGTGVMSWFAAQRAAKVISVEFNPALVEACRRFLALNKGGERVTVVQADASDYLPDAPVDVVICEMLHSALLREKQLTVIAAFRRSYAERFGKLPRFLPEVTLLAAQPVHQVYDFDGYYAPVPLFQAAAHTPDCSGLAEPAVYASIDYSEADEQLAGDLTFTITQAGTVNAIRFITKNLLAILPAERRSIDWHNHYLVLPLAAALEVRPGGTLKVQFAYQAGDSIETLTQALHVSYHG